MLSSVHFHRCRQVSMYRYFVSNIALFYFGNFVCSLYGMLYAQDTLFMGTTETRKHSVFRTCMPS